MNEESKIEFKKKVKKGRKAMSHSGEQKVPDEEANLERLQLGVKDHRKDSLSKASQTGLGQTCSKFVL